MDRAGDARHRLVQPVGAELQAHPGAGPRPGKKGAGSCALAMRLGVSSERATLNGRRCPSTDIFHAVQFEARVFTQHCF